MQVSVSPASRTRPAFVIQHFGLVTTNQMFQTHSSSKYCVVSQGAGDWILLKTERSLVDGSVRTLKK
jgi:hypothetical protein